MKNLFTYKKEATWMIGIQLAVILGAIILIVLNFFNR